MPSRTTLARLAGVTCLAVSLGVASTALSTGCGGDDSTPEDNIDLGGDSGGADGTTTKNDGGGEVLPGDVQEPSADDNATGPVNIGNPVRPDGGFGGGGEKTCFENPRPGCPNYPPGGSDGGLIITTGDDGGVDPYPPLQDPPDDPDPNADDPVSAICDDLEDGDPGCPAFTDPDLPSGCDNDVSTPEVCTDKRPPKCGKRIFVDFQVYGALDPVIRTNGCWIPYAPRIDGSFRKGEYPASLSNLNAPRWFYNWVSPEHTLTEDKNMIASLSVGGASDGYEFFSRNATKWRFINSDAVSAYFGEVYSDETHMDNYWKSYIALRKRSVGADRLYPMVNVGVPYAKFSTKKIQREMFRICRRLPNYAHLAIYSNANYALSGEFVSPRQKRIIAALNACTRPKSK
jgi:hypothetical protein